MRALAPRGLSLSLSLSIARSETLVAYFTDDRPSYFLNFIYYFYFYFRSAGVCRRDVAAF